MTGSPFLAALRFATGDMHYALEREADIEGALRDRDGRAQAVARFHAFHHGVEAAVAPWTDAFHELDLDWRPRRPMITRDLETLGQTPSAGTVARPADSLGEALGWVYVSEGSMLGGRVMLKAMRRDGVGTDGLTFLDPYGDETGPRWQAFCHALEVAGALGRARVGDVVKGGCDAFGLASRLLVPRREMEPAA